MKRGPKVRTSRNASDRRQGLIRRETTAPPSDLTDVAKAEYDRLIAVLEAKGTLDRLDLGIVAEAARIKALLDRAHADVLLIEPRAIQVVALLTSQRRGLLRELGLTLQPSRSVVRGNSGAPDGDAEEDPIREHLKISG